MLLTPLSLAFVAFGLWLIGAFGSTRPQEQVLTIIGWVLIVLFGLFAVLIAKRIFETGPVMRIDARGIWWKNWSSATIPWDAVAGVHLVEISHQKMVGIELIDPKLYPAETWTGRAQKGNRALMGYDAIWLTVTGSNRSYKELEAAVAFHFRQR